MMVGQDGSVYEDFYHCVFEAQRFSKWEDIANPVMQALLSFPEKAGWGIPEAWQDLRANEIRGLDSVAPPSKGSPRAQSQSPGMNPAVAERYPYSGAVLPCLAIRGNLLEAVNLCLNGFETHFLRRGFEHTGQFIVCVSPGNGAFEVSPELERITKNRMMDIGIGCDLVCLANPPLHNPPIFIFPKSMRASATFKNRPSLSHSTRNAGGKKTPHAQFVMPYWMHCSFYRERHQTASESEKECGRQLSNSSCGSRTAIRNLPRASTDRQMPSGTPGPFNS